MSDNKEISFKEKIKSLSFRGSEKPVKITTDVHDTHTVDVTEHWSERVDVTVKPNPVSVSLKLKGE